MTGKNMRRLGFFAGVADAPQIAAVLVAEGLDFQYSILGQRAVFEVVETPEFSVEFVLARAQSVMTGTLGETWIGNSAGPHWMLRAELSTLISTLEYEADEATTDLITSKALRRCAASIQRLLGGRTQP